MTKRRNDEELAEEAVGEFARYIYRLNKKKQFDTTISMLDALISLARDMKVDCQLMKERHEQRAEA